MNSSIMSQHTPPLDGLLAGLRCALGTESPAEDADVLDRVSDWRAVAGLAAHHRVVTLFLRGLRSSGVAVPDSAVERDLEIRRRRNVTRGMRQLDAMRHAVNGLAARGIPALVLKGLPLGHRLYGDPFAKESVDVDLLVAPDTFAAAGRVLRDLGWRQSMPDCRETPARKRWSDRVLNQYVFMGRGGKLELHRSLLINPFLFDPTFTALDGHATTIEVAGCKFRALGDVDEFLYLACHGSMHYWVRLKWLCDFAMLVRSIDDGTVEHAFDRALNEGLTEAVAPALNLSRSALHVHVPPAAAAPPVGTWRTRFATGISRRAWYPRGVVRPIVHRVATRIGPFFIRRGVRYKMHEISRHLILPLDFRHVELPDRLFWLYALLRPVLWLLRLLRSRT